MVDAAAVVCPGEESGADRLALRLGGLSLLARSLLAARHAGFDRLMVVGGEGQREALMAHWEGDPRLVGVVWLEAGIPPNPLPQNCLLLRPEVVIAAGDLRAWVEGLPPSADAAAPDPGGLGPVAISSDLLPAAIKAARMGAQGLAAFLAELAEAGRLKEVPWGGAIREAVTSPAVVPAVERKMLRALRNPKDGPVVDRFVNRTVSRWLSRRLVNASVTPNQVTIASLLTGLLGAWLLASADWRLSFSALLLFQWSVILDNADGEVARLKYQFSPLGKWLDNWSDHVVDVAVIGGLAWRVALEGRAGSPILLGLAAAAGVTGSFLIVFLWSLAADRAAERLPAAVPAMANRDGFCLALWATVLLDRPAWFLWILALGANVYWLVWLVRAGLPPRRARPRRPTSAS